MQIRATSGEFPRRRLVLRWGAAGGGGDVTIGKFEPVGGRDRLCLVGESEAVESFVQPIAGRISGEHTPRAVGAVCRRGQSDDEHVCVAVTETGNRPSPIR